MSERVQDASTPFSFACQKCTGSLIKFVGFFSHCNPLQDKLHQIYATTNLFANYKHWNESETFYTHSSYFHLHQKLLMHQFFLSNTHIIILPYFICSGFKPEKKKHENMGSPSCTCQLYRYSTLLPFPTLDTLGLILTIVLKTWGFFCIHQQPSPP